MEITKITVDLVKVAIFGGYLLVIFGILYLFFPQILIKLNSWANKLSVNLDEKSFTYRIPYGLALLVIGGIILIILYKFL